MKIEIDRNQLNQVKALTAEIKNGYKKVFVTSINKTLTTARTQATARIGNEINLKASRIKEDFTMQKANYQQIRGALLATGEPVGLYQFGARQVQKGVTVKVLRSASRSLLKHAFIAKGNNKSNKLHVWWRGGRDRMPAPKKFRPGKISKAAWPKFGHKYQFPPGPKKDSGIQRRTGPRIEDIYGQNRVLDPVMIQANHVFLRNVEAKTDEVIRRYG